LEQVDCLQGIEVAAQPRVVDLVVPETVSIEDHAQPVSPAQAHRPHQVVLLEIHLAHLSNRCRNATRSKDLPPAAGLEVVESVSPMLSRIVANSQIREGRWGAGEQAEFERRIFELAS